MKLKSIKIENLFGLFHYDISFSANENVLIVTGPNGFGKTMVLNMIFNLFGRNFSFFMSLSFNEILMTLNDGTSIKITKIVELNKSLVRFKFCFDNGEVVDYDYSSEHFKGSESSLTRYLPVTQVDYDRWYDMSTEKYYTTDALLLEYKNMLPDNIINNILGSNFNSILSVKSEKVNSVLDAIKVHLIREQRLFKKVINLDKGRRGEREQTVMTETIQAYSRELKEMISEYSQKSFTQSQALDSSYPNRLISEKGKVSEEEYKERFTKLKQKQEKLSEFGLYESEQKVLDYSADDAKALLVYLNDFEQKLGVFDSLLEKLELFTTILNERRFTFKQINISRSKGFYFNTTRGVDLDLNQLSSGEQHEVVLLYELIFNTAKNILVLIDEPEISLHITWQKEFLNDLLRIVKIQSMQVVIATHSPSIINDRWDLVYNLEVLGV